MSGGQRQLKKGNQARVHSNHMILMMARQKAGLGDQWPKTLKTKLSSRGTTRLEFT
jgi:hypothetical protein